MLNLWRKTIEIFRKYPILWVPYVCADLAASCLGWLRRLAGKAILHWVATTHTRSVLGGDVVTTNFDYETMKKALLLSGPLGWGTHYINACLYTAALILTAILVAFALRGEKPDLLAAMPTLRTSLRRILLFSLIFCAFTFVLIALLTIPTSYLIRVKYPSNQALFHVMTIGGEFLLMLCSAWIMAPIAITLIRPEDADAVSVEQKRLGRRFAMLAGVATVGLEQLFGLAMRVLNPTSHLGLALVQPLSSLLVNSPFILLFIALALIAAEDSLDIRSDSAPGIPGFLRTLMPLHFGQGGEP